MEAVTAILSKEHKTVLSKLDRFEKALSSGDTDMVNKTVDFFENKLVLHRIKEEDHLFKELEKYLTKTEGPVAVMLHEHKIEKELIGQLKAALKENNLQKVKQAGSEIITLLRNHIWKEDNILFKLAEEHMNDEEKQRVRDAFEKVGSCCEECNHVENG